MQIYDVFVRHLWGRSNCKVCVYSNVVMVSSLIVANFELVDGHLSLVLSACKAKRYAFIQLVKGVQMTYGFKTKKTYACNAVAPPVSLQQLLLERSFCWELSNINSHS